MKLSKKQQKLLLKIEKNAAAGVLRTELNDSEILAGRSLYLNDKAIMNIIKRIKREVKGGTVFFTEYQVYFLKPIV